MKNVPVNYKIIMGQHELSLYCQAHSSNKMGSINYWVFRDYLNQISVIDFAFFQKDYIVWKKNMFIIIINKYNPSYSQLLGHCRSHTSTSAFTIQLVYKFIDDSLQCIHSNQIKIIKVINGYFVPRSLTFKIW